MQLISIDVGIKNLAYCILEKNANANAIADANATTNAIPGDYKIIKWDSINLCGDEPNCLECKNKASYTKNEENYCLTHAKKTGFIIPTKDKSPSAIKKLKIENLITLANDYKIAIDVNNKKNEILKTVIDFFNKNMMEKTNKTSANSLDLVTIGISLKQEFDKIVPLVTIDKVIIENQISPIANRMKTIQGMIAQYFIMCGIQDVTFVSSVNKLKAFTDTDQNKSAQNKSDQNKSDYKDRKKLGIEITKGIIEKMKDWTPFFLAHKKKDDLADSFLQGIWFLQK
jgi:acyl carrier protein